jgi:hypothetical protein
VEGLEPPRLAAPEPKSGASANFATPASAHFLANAASRCERENAWPAPSSTLNLAQFLPKFAGIVADRETKRR